MECFVQLIEFLLNADESVADALDPGFHFLNGFPPIPLMGLYRKQVSSAFFAKPDTAGRVRHAGIPLPSPLVVQVVVYPATGINQPIKCCFQP
jgi:hypothetical protein